MAYIVFCVFAAGLVAYPLHLALPEDLIYFKTLVGRGAEALLVVGLIPLASQLGIGKAQMGIALPKGQFLMEWGKGFAFGALMLAAHTIVIVLLDVRVLIYFNLDAMNIVRMAGKGLLIGIAISSIEEPVFRGFLLGSLLCRTNRYYAVIISAFYFALLHFLETGLRPASSEVQWNTGLILAWDAFGHFRKIQLNSFLALFVAGIFLGLIRLYCPGKGLPMCIGIHAGWVFVIKSAKPFTYREPTAPLNWLVSNFDGFIGYLSSAWMSLLILALIWMILKKPDAAVATQK